MPCGACGTDAKSFFPRRSWSGRVTSVKAVLVALFAIVAVTVPLRGQTSSASAAEKSATVETSGLTSDERKRAIDYLKQTREEFLAAIDGLSEEQWNFKPAPDRWSIAEAAEHIAVAEEKIWKLVSEKIMKSPAHPEMRAEVKGKEEKILQGVPDRSRKAEAPEGLQPTGKWSTRAALEKDFTATRDEELEFLAETKQDLRSHFGDHPFLNAMDAWQWLLFNGAHSKRHTAQILEVKADPNFPKS